MNAIDGAIRDVAPHVAGEIPTELRQLTSRLYASSKQRIQLRPQEEVARHHLCAIVAVQRHLHTLNITAPSLDGVPLPPKTAEALLTTFIKQLESPSVTSTPTATPMATPQSNRVRELELVNTTTPSPSPSKRGKGRPPGSKSKSKFMKDLTKSLPSLLHNDKTKTNITESLIDTQQHMLLLSSREITVLCNKFQLDSALTHNVIATYTKYWNKVANEWTLICGLILNCYNIIHHQLLDEVVGTRSEVERTMFSLQSGGLMRGDVHRSADVVLPLIVHQRWFKELKRQHGFVDAAQEVDSGSMLVSRFRFHSLENTRAYDEWIAGIRNT